MRKRKAWVIVLVALIALSSMATAFSVDSAPSARVVFKAGEPDANGVFTVALTIYNAKFNAFQFGLRYDKDTVIPVDGSGKSTAAFHSFAAKSDKTGWMSTIGTHIDLDAGLIEFAGYVTPGSYSATDGLNQVTGYVSTGQTGIHIYNMQFKKLSAADVIIEIANKEDDKPFSKSLPEGAALFDAGKSVPLTVNYELPTSIGQDSTYVPQRPIIVEAPMTVKERLYESLVLQIGNYGAAVGGALIHVDPDNKEVVPYIDENNRTMVPIRFIAERLGADVEWKQESREVVITLGDKKIVMRIGIKEYTVNGQEKRMDTAPKIQKGWNRTMVPIRFISEDFGMSVTWDQGNKLVVITPKDKPWELGRQVEKEATQNILLIISPLVRDFI